MSEPTRPTAETQVWPGHAAAERYETPIRRPGRLGLNVDADLDVLQPEELSRAVNVRARNGGALFVRSGQTSQGTTAQGYGHSLYRINDPQDSTYARLAGLGTTLYRGTTGAFTLIDSGYSGDPLTFAAVNMPAGNTPFVFIGDRARMRKVQRTGSVEEIGIPPAGAITTAVAAEARKAIALFDSTDGTQAANWTTTAGQDRSGNASGTPTVVDVTLPLGGDCVQMETVVGSATGAYDSLISIAKAVNLAWITDGSLPASDDDHIHVLFNISQPQYLEEIKIYLVCSGAFTAGQIPGASAFNADAFFTSFRPNDLQPYFERTQSGLDAGEALRTRTLVEQFKIDQGATDTRDGLYLEALQLDRQAIRQIPVGRNVWGEFGVLGAPLRRGDWQRIGTDTTRGWHTITGIVIVVQTSAAQVLVVQLNDWWITGGYGPDNSDPGLNKYDVRVINVHRVTGSKGNPSPVQDESAWLDALRQRITVTPQASGDANLRQHAYLRGGGALGTQDWYYAGENSSDGGAITIAVSDDERVTSETLEIDNDQPVTSTDVNGGTALHQTVPVFFTVDRYVFALGDSNQPGRLYRSKPDMPESWPATDYQDVCGAAEVLQNGCDWASGGVVFSLQRMYAILLGADGTWTTEPTACAEGLAGRWALCKTPYGLAFISPFGVRITQGGAPTTLSDGKVGRLFRGEAVNGYSPVDYTQATALRVAYHDDELWVSYADTTGARRHLVYNFKDQAWWGYLFGRQVGQAYSEPVEHQRGTLLLIGSGTGAVYTHEGTTDDGTAISFTARTGAWDFGQPRNEKSFSEVVVDAELLTGTLTVQAFLNDEATSVTAQAVVGSAGAKRYLFEPFGTTPQRGRNVSVELRGSGTGGSTYLAGLGVTTRLEPQIKQNEPSPWEELPGGEGYLWGVAITCDTGGEDLTMYVETTTTNGSITQVATLTVNANGRRKLPFAIPYTLGQQVRLRPENECGPWICWKIEWLSDPEPIRVTGWDTNWESFGTFADKWIKGYLIEADTFNVAKTVVLDVTDSDGVQQLAQNSLTLTRNGRGIYQHSFAKIRGRLFRLRATDANFGKFYRWQPIFDEEPLSLTRWETQERPFEGLAGKWQKPMEAFVTLRSSASVTWAITTTGASGAALNTSQYTIASTSGAKQKVRVPLNAVKGLLFAHVFSSGSAFWLYKEESEILVEDWATGEARWLPLFPANDDLDPVRGMGNAAGRAATPNQ